MIRFKIYNTTKRLTEVGRCDLERDFTQLLNVGKVVIDLGQAFKQVTSSEVSELPGMPYVVISEGSDRELFVFASSVFNHIPMNVSMGEAVEVFFMSTYGSHSHHMRGRKPNAFTEVVNLLRIQLLSVQFFSYAKHLYGIYLKAINSIKLLTVKRPGFFLGIFREGFPKNIFRRDRQAVTITPRKERFQSTHDFTGRVRFTALEQVRNEQVVIVLIDLFQFKGFEIHKLFKSAMVSEDILLSDDRLSDRVNLCLLLGNEVLKVFRETLPVGNDFVSIVSDRLEADLDVIRGEGLDGVHHYPFFNLSFDPIELVINQDTIVTGGRLVNPVAFLDFDLSGNSESLTINIQVDADGIGGETGEMHTLKITQNIPNLTRILHEGHKKIPKSLNIKSLGIYYAVRTGKNEGFSLHCTPRKRRLKRIGGGLVYQYRSRTPKILHKSYMSCRWLWRVF